MSRNIISHAQFAGLGGGSRRLEDQSEGPKRGYYVSRDPDTEVKDGGSFEAVVDTNRPEDAQAHLDLIREAGAETARPDHSPDEVYQGTWEERGKRYYDVSDRFPASPSGLMHTLQHGMANAQLAAWAAHSPEGKQGMPVVPENEAEEKLGPTPQVRYVANALHAKEAERARQKRR